MVTGEEMLREQQDLAQCGRVRGRSKNEMKIVF